MKLLLTSSGLSNGSIAGAFQDLLGKDPRGCKVAFIPTAAHAERGNKGWLINDLYRIKELGYYVDIIDIAVIQHDELEGALADMDAIFVGGGNTFYLSYWMRESGLAKLLPELLRTKVYAGISAGSIVAGASLTMASQALKNPQAFRDEDYYDFAMNGQAAGNALQLVDFVFRPHLNSPHFPLVSAEKLEAKAKDVPLPIYALDDHSALKIIDSEIEVISEGEWLLLNENI